MHGLRLLVLLLFLMASRRLSSLIRQIQWRARCRLFLKIRPYLNSLFLCSLSKIRL